MSGITFKMTVATNVGLVRSNNEDNFIVSENPNNKEWFVPSDPLQDIVQTESGVVLAVADGMGGMNAGEVASAIVVDSIKEAFTRSDYSSIIATDKNVASFMKDTIIDADARIKSKAEEDKSTAGMGTTIVWAWILGRKAHIVWCGDSRAYLFNSNSGLVRLTKDHSYVQELVDAGKLDAELAFDHPNSKIITRSLGDSSVKARPDYISHILQEGDCLLLCSDGLCGLCKDDDIARVMSEAENIEECKKRLINEALDAGGYDNVTVALLKVSSLSNKEEDITDTTNDIANVKVRKSKNFVLSVLIIAMLVLTGLLFMLLK